MSYNIEVTALFKRQLKRLAKKFPSFKAEYIQLITLLKEDPQQGSALGNNCYKIRLAIASKDKGKSGGARVIAHLHIMHNKVYLLSVYDKSEQSDVTDKDLADWVKMLE
jgi:hypothetical protein